MTHKFLLFLLLVLSCKGAWSQIKREEIAFEFNANNTVVFETSCLYEADRKLPFAAGYTALWQFYNSIRSGQLPALDKERAAYLRDLLLLAKKAQVHACILPIVELIDSNAREIYDRACHLTSWKNPHPIYCERPDIRYLLVFYCSSSISRR